MWELSLFPWVVEFVFLFGGGALDMRKVAEMARYAIQSVFLSSFLAIIYDILCLHYLLISYIYLSFTHLCLIKHLTAIFYEVAKMKYQVPWFLHHQVPHTFCILRRCQINCIKAPVLFMA